MSDTKDQRFLPSSRIEKQKDVLREERMSQTEHKEKRQTVIEGKEDTYSSRLVVWSGNNVLG